MLLIAILALFGNGYQYQRSFDICLESNFTAISCDFHFQNVVNNPKSKHHKKWNLNTKRIESCFYHFILL